MEFPKTFTATVLVVIITCLTAGARVTTQERICEVSYERNNDCSRANAGIPVRPSSIRSCECVEDAWMRCEQTSRGCIPTATLSASRNPVAAPVVSGPVAAVVATPSLLTSVATGTPSEKSMSASDNKAKAGSGGLGDNKEVIETSETLVQPHSGSSTANVGNAAPPELEIAEIHVTDSATAKLSENLGATV